jgi:CO/xanthine dehydrogenase FAD-binding subunit
MIPVLDGYQLVTPDSLGEALADLAAHPRARPFAGGTDLMVVLEAGHLPPGRYVSLAKCPELRGIVVTPDGGLSIGALTTYTEIRDSAAIGAPFAMLKEAAAETGGVATQNRGTIGGNIANASPAADTPPVLLAYDATLELVSSSGTRRVNYAAFHRSYKQMDLRPGELVARVVLPSRIPPEGGNYKTREGPSALQSDSVASAFRRNAWRDYYRKVGTRRAQAISKICFAGSIRMDGATVADVRIALGSVAPTVIRATAVEQALRGRVLDAAAVSGAELALASAIAPIDDVRSTARYRSRVAVNLLREFLSL